jgi:hypothetical protein
MESVHRKSAYRRCVMWRQTLGLPQCGPIGTLTPNLKKLVAFFTALINNSWNLIKAKNLAELIRIQAAFENKTDRKACNKQIKNTETQE